MRRVFDLILMELQWALDKGLAIPSQLMNKSGNPSKVSREIKSDSLILLPSIEIFSLVALKI